MVIRLITHDTSTDHSRHRLASGKFPGRDNGDALGQPERAGAHVQTGGRHRRPRAVGSQTPGLSLLDPRRHRRARTSGWAIIDLKHLQRLRAFIRVLTEHLRELGHG